MNPAVEIMPKHNTVPLIFIGCGTLGQTLFRQSITNHDLVIRQVVQSLITVTLAVINLSKQLSAGGACSMS